MGLRILFYRSNLHSDNFKVVVKATCFVMVVCILLFCTTAYARDLTFLVTSDLHYGYESIEASNPAQITVMNNLPGKPYPAAIGGTVAIPKFVLVSGDLTHRNTNTSWSGPTGFLAQYGLNGTDGLLNYPVYECRGNHDKDNDAICGNCITNSITERHGNIYYSFNANGVHIVCLDDYPTLEILNWLNGDLASMSDPCMPVILFHHRPLTDSSLDSQRQYYMSIIGKYKILALFYGHLHSSSHSIYNDPYSNAVYDTFLTDSPTRHTSPNFFYVVHITDDTMTVVENNWSGGGQWHNYYVKTIESSVSPTDTIIFSDATDTMLAAGAPDSDYSHRQSIGIDLSDSSLGGLSTEVLIRFKNIFGNDANHLPTDANIISAELRLNTTDSGDGATVHNMLVDWNDSDDWNAFGGDGIAAGVEADINPVAIVSNPSTGMTIIDVTGSVKKWQSHGADNYGWVLLPMGQNGWDFGSGEGSISPKLIVQYKDEFSKYDLYKDGKINFLDFAVFAEQWMQFDCGSCDGAELNGDNIVNFLDFAEFAKVWKAE